MNEEQWETTRLFDELEKCFDRDLVERYRSLTVNPTKGFETTHHDFNEMVAAAATADHDINREGVKQKLILGHVLLAIFSGLSKGKTSWMALPEMKGKKWSQIETDLLLWAAQHGSSDVRTLPNSPGTPKAAATRQERGD